MEEKLTPKIFLNKVLAGTATGIIVGLKIGRAHV